MSFGWSASDILLVLNLCTKAYKAWKGAGGEYAAITSELRMLRSNLSRAKTDAEFDDSLYVRSKDDVDAWHELLESCNSTVIQLLDVVEKYRGVNSEHRGRRVWDRIRLSAKDINDLRERVHRCNASISTYLSVTTVSALQRLEPKLDDIAKINALVQDVPAIRDKVDELRARQRDPSAMTAHSDDDTLIWRQFRRDLRKRGFTGRTVYQYSEQLMNHLQQLATNEVFGPTATPMLGEEAVTTGADDLQIDETEHSRVTEDTPSPTYRRRRSPSLPTKSSPQQEASSTSEVEEQPSQDAVLSSSGVVVGKLQNFSPIFRVTCEDAEDEYPGGTLIEPQSPSDPHHRSRSAPKPQPRSPSSYSYPNPSQAYDPYDPADYTAGRSPFTPQITPQSVNAPIVDPPTAPYASLPYRPGAREAEDINNSHRYHEARPPRLERGYLNNGPILHLPRPSRRRVAGNPDPTPSASHGHSIPLGPILRRLSKVSTDVLALQSVDDMFKTVFKNDVHVSTPSTPSKDARPILHRNKSPETSANSRATVKPESIPRSHNKKRPERVVHKKKASGRGASPSRKKKEPSRDDAYNRKGFGSRNPSPARQTPQVPKKGNDVPYQWWLRGF